MTPTHLISFYQGWDDDRVFAGHDASSVSPSALQARQALASSAEERLGESEMSCGVRGAFRGRCAGLALMSGVVGVHFAVSNRERVMGVFRVRRRESGGADHSLCRAVPC